MRTSFIETKQLDGYLQRNLSEEDAAVIEARLLLEPHLTEKLKWQKLSYQLVTLYGRKKLKAEIETIHQKLFNNPEHEGFRQKVYRLFSRF